MVLDPAEKMNYMLTKTGLWGSMIALIVPTVCLIPISVWLSKASKEKVITEEKSDLSVKSMISDAFTNKSYQLLLFAFFTCGFHMAIIETHLYSNMTISGLSDSAAAYLFSLYGITTMVGSILTGALSSRFKMKWIAGVTFSSRLIIFSTGLFPFSPHAIQ